MITRIISFRDLVRDLETSFETSFASRTLFVLGQDNLLDVLVAALRTGFQRPPQK